MIQLHQLSKTLSFPAPEHALYDPNGLLAYGGDLSVERLKCAYYNGIFPWFGEGEPILWWSPDPRGILPISDYAPSKSLRKLIRSGRFSVTINSDFQNVIEHCATVPRGGDGVWITDEMVNAYSSLHKAGHAHSVEVWENEILVGGLYGVCVGQLFCGESMFHTVSNASKIAFHYLVEHLKHNGFRYIDTQLQNEHLKSLGVIEIPREQFLLTLEHCRDLPAPLAMWQKHKLTS